MSAEQGLGDWGNRPLISPSSCDTIRQQMSLLPCTVRNVTPLARIHCALGAQLVCRHGLAPCGAEKSRQETATEPRQTATRAVISAEIRGPRTAEPPKSSRPGTATEGTTRVKPPTASGQTAAEPNLPRKARTPVPSPGGRRDDSNAMPSMKKCLKVSQSVPFR